MWNQAGLHLVTRAHGGNLVKPVLIQDPKFNSHVTDLKPLFPELLSDYPYVVCRNKNMITLVDINNLHIQPLIEIRNAELFCEKLALTAVNNTV